MNFCSFWRRFAPLTLGLVTMALGACAPQLSTNPPPPVLTLAPVAFADLPGWSTDRTADVLPALLRSCTRWSSWSADHELGLGVTVADWRPICTAAATIPAGDDLAAQRLFKSWFRPYRAGNHGDPSGLFTGYYEPELRASRRRHGPYQVPLYTRPPDAIALPSRAEIVAGALADRVPVLAWVDDPVDAFFLQIQGSGRLGLDDGTVMRVGFAGQNGYPYVAIGRELVERGALTREEATMPGIRGWLTAHPDQIRAILDSNPSYVFFKEVKGDGPTGAQGVVLTPGRSLAVDHNFMPYGLPVWLDAEDPLEPTVRLQRVLMTQDTGGAIRGPVRGDVFWGYGVDAVARAGVMRSAGGYFVLIPRTVTPAP